MLHPAYFRNRRCGLSAYSFRTALGHGDLATGIAECDNPSFDGGIDGGVVGKCDSTFPCALYFRDPEQGGMADADVEPEAEWGTRDYHARASGHRSLAASVPQSGKRARMSSYQSTSIMPPDVSTGDRNLGLEKRMMIGRFSRKGAKPQKGRSAKWTRRHRIRGVAPGPMERGVSDVSRSFHLRSRQRSGQQTCMLGRASGPESNRDPLGFCPWLAATTSCRAARRTGSPRPGLQGAPRSK
jgi:hypothetical protein